MFDRVVSSVSVVSAIFAVIVLCSVWYFYTLVPHAYVENTDYDFGEVRAGEVVEHSFQLTNDGKDILHVLQLRPSCNCTSASVATNTLKPGESTPIVVQFEMMPNVYVTTTSVVLTTNDPRTPKIVLRATAKNKPKLEIIPEFFDFGAVPYGTGASCDHKVVLPTGNLVTVRVEDFEMQSPVRAELLPAAHSRTALGPVIRITLSEDAPIGPITARLVLTTNGSKDSECTYNIGGEVVGILSAEPRQINMVVSRGSPSETIQIRLSSQMSKLQGVLQLDEISDNINPFVDAQVVSKDGDTMLVVCQKRSPPMGDAAQLNGAVKLTSIHDARVHLVVPVHINVAE